MYKKYPEVNMNELIELYIKSENKLNDLWRLL